MNIRKILLKVFYWRARYFERATHDPERAQTRVLLSYIRRNRATAYGTTHGFAGIRSSTDYQARVPLSDGESMRPLIARMMGGEERVLTVDRPVFFGATSGTTTAPKFVPSTHFSERKNAKLLSLWGYYAGRDHPDVFTGKVLAIVSPEVEGVTRSGLPYGAESGHGYRNLPFFIRDLYALPYEVFEIKDYDSRYYTILRIAIEQDITSIATLNPNTLILLSQKIPEWQELIIDDITNGTLDQSFPMDERFRTIISKRLSPNPARARELVLILKKYGTLLPKYVWPRLKLIECWKAGTVTVYLKELPHYFGNVAVRDLGCLSTEARCSIPMNDSDAGGVLSILTNFYEFIPRDKIGRPGTRPLLAHQLTRGEEYFIIVTTPGGLYRYHIDDIVKVTGFFNKTPVIEFVQKGSNATSLAGEKLYETHVNSALTKTFESTHIFLTFFCAVAHASDGPRYIFLAELAEDIAIEKKKAFLVTLDRMLAEEDREYDYVRQAQLLKPPVLHVIARGEFEKYRAARISAGAHDGQFKTAELTADIKFADKFRVVEKIALD